MLFRGLSLVSLHVPGITATRCRRLDQARAGFDPPTRPDLLLWALALLARPLDLARLYRAAAASLSSLNPRAFLIALISFAAAS